MQSLRARLGRKPNADNDAENQVAVPANDGENDVKPAIALDEHKKSTVPYWLGIFRVGLFITCLLLCCILLAAIVLMVTRAPFEPVFWVYMFCLICYWILSVTLVGISMRVYKLRNDEEGIGSCTKPAMIREVKRVEFWVFMFSLLMTFIVMLIMLAIALPETFFPSTGLQLQRLAGVTDSEVVLWIRNPSLGEDAQVSVEIRLNGTSDPFVVSGDTAILNGDNDYAGFVRVGGLSAATVYEARFKEDPKETLIFTTNPAPGTPSKFSFYFGSCFLHNFPVYKEAPGFGYVLDLLKPDLFTFLGDFIYSDVPFFRDDTLGTYKSLYRHTLSNSHVQRLFKAIPNYNMWDDHEVQNDFPDINPTNLKRAGRASFDNAINGAWQMYLGGGNPISYPDKTYFNFDYGDSSFFFWDTRVNRTSNEVADSANKTMLGAVQKAAFKQWLLDKSTTSKFKFVMSPVGLTYDFPTTVDSWGGYKTERDEIFEFIRDNLIEGVAFFSGDSHFAYALELGGAAGGLRGGLYEFSASPTSAFDYTLGGYLSSTPFKDLSEREDNIFFQTIGRVGPMSLLGLTRVDTTKAIPEISVEFYDGTTKLFTYNLTLTMMRPWAAT